MVQGDVPHDPAHPGRDAGGGVELVELNDALGAANLLVALVDHSEFKQIPLSQVTSKVVIDTRGLW